MGLKGIIEYKGFYWVVNRKVVDRPEVKIDLIKDISYSDMCLRKNGLLYFVTIVEDVICENL
jgi:hypothetical protein